MSSRVRKELSNMGFSNNHIERAFKMFKKTYGDQYNIIILTELIFRLQTKDKSKRHSVPYTRSDMVRQLPQLEIQSVSIDSNILSNSKHFQKINRKRHDPLIKPDINIVELGHTPPLPPSKPFKSSKPDKSDHIDYLKKSKRRKPKKRKRSKHKFKTVPTISDDTNDLQTPPLPTHSSNKRINGRELKRMMTFDRSTDISSSPNGFMRDRLSSDDTEKKTGMKLALDEYSLSSPPTHNSDCEDDIMPDDVFQRQSERILMQNRQRYSLQDLKTNKKRIVPMRNSDIINTLSVPLFKELETTFSALKKIKDGVESKPKLREKERSKTRKNTMKMKQYKARQRVLNRRRQSEPTAKIKKKEHVFDNKQMIDKIIGIKEYKLWDLNNERVDVYRYKCSNIKYHLYAPTLSEVMYPTVLSSTVLPPSLCNIDHKYRVNVLFNIETFTNSELYTDKTEFAFDLNTTTVHVIDALLDRIKNNMNMNSSCFMLKVDGREEFLKYNDNHKVIELNYVRECIRNDEMEDLQFILLYVEGLYNNDSQYKADFDEKTVETETQNIKYENMGFNVIFNALNDAECKENAFDVFTKYVKEEVDWVSNKVGTMNNDHDDDWMMNYDSIDKTAILLSEFEAAIEIKLCSIHNITLCPRYKADDHYFLLIRTELMFGTEVYSECCWDIRIPSEFISDTISIPYPECNFSSDPKELTYAMLPRECIWNITIYGVQKDKKRESAIATQEKKVIKPKLISRSTPSMINLDFNIKSSSNNQYDYGAMAISDKSRLISCAQKITSSNINSSYSDNKSKYIPEAIAWCRIPLINSKHCLHKGQQSINLWPIPVQKEEMDAYCLDRQVWKQFGCTYPRTKKKSSPDEAVVSIEIEFFFSDYNCSTLSESITETFNVAPTTRCDKLSFDIVAPIVNRRRSECLFGRVLPYSGKSNFSRKALLSCIVENDDASGLLSERDKLLISSNKSKLMRDGSTLCTYLNSVHWCDEFERTECYDYLSKWAINNNNISDVICLLKHNFADNYIRLYAVSQLNKLDDFTLNKYLFQLIEALKVEIHHCSFLSRFLMFRALRNPYQIGHYLFWCIKAQLFVNAWYYERFALLIEEYLSHLAPFVKHNIFKQYELVNKLKIISSQIREKRKLSIHKSNKSLLNRETKILLTKQLTLLNSVLFSRENDIQFPLNPLIKIKHFVISQCSIVSNKKIILTFITESSDDRTLSVVFKYGDQLKYDVLTTNLLDIMDMLWLKNNIDLKIKRYLAIQMGSKSGFIYYKKKRNDAKKGINVLFKKNINEKKREFYARSLAGYCIATWILGIETNKTNYKNTLQITNNGELFYINFCNLLFKNNDNRNDAPFLFTNFMKLPIKNIKQLEIWMFHAFCLLRRRYKLLHALLTLSSYSPINQNKMDIAKYVESHLKSKLRFDLNNYDNKIKLHIQDSLQSALMHKK